MTYSESLGFEETRPPGLELELTDNEDATMGGLGMVSNAPPNRARKLKQSTLFVCLFVCLFGPLTCCVNSCLNHPLAETLILENDDNSSLDNHCSHFSKTEDSAKTSLYSEDDESANCHGRCILMPLIFYFERHVTVGYFT